MKKYIIAVDLGTTTIELCLVDINENKVIASDYFKNRQSLYGRDVINRVFASIRQKDNLFKMKDFVIKDVELSIITLCKQNGIDFNNITQIIISGNTTMASIILEHDISSLGEYPFNKELTTSVHMKANVLWPDVLSDDCEVIILGCTSAFIGGDILSGYIYLQNQKLIENNSLFLDLGTNGEMMLFRDDGIYATSAACGPAFEASVRKQNTYGSSVIDAIAFGVMTKNISKEGILKNEYLESGINIMNINLTADIIRSILVAKAAIITGIDMLLKEVNITFKDISNIYLAGNFGFYLNIQNAIKINLLPDIPISKYKVLGNTSLKGAILIGMDEKTNKYLEYIDKMINANIIQVIQPALDENYQELLLSNMTF